MTVIESDYIQAGVPTMESYFDTLMHDACITSEELASILECPVEHLYELLAGTSNITTADITALERSITIASHQALLVVQEACTTLLVGYQMMRVIQNI